MGHAAHTVASTSEFRTRILAIVRRIPAGRVVTYGDVAVMAGRPLACRAVGNHLRGCHDPGVPCHRVIGANGSLGGFAGDLQLKRARLRAEGVDVGIARVRDFAAVRWAPGRRGRAAAPR